MSRLLGVDAARCVALLGMMMVHILPPLDRDGVSLPYQLFSGRASALFAVLAGVALALAYGRTDPPVGADLSLARRRLALRAAVVAGVGLLLGLVPSGIAVILVNYGVLFLAATLFLGLSARALGLLAGGWLLLSPLLSHGLRLLLPPGPGPVPSLATFAAPLELGTNVLFTGYYPVLQWTGYLLVGLCVGRLDLNRMRVVLSVLAAGLAVALLAPLSSTALLSASGGGDLPVPAGSSLARYPQNLVSEVSLFGVTPTTSWRWLLVDSPHSATPFDLLHTSGTSLVVLSLMLLLARPVPVRVLLWPLYAAGTIPLTLYTLHVLLLVPSAALVPDAPSLWVLHATAALAFGALWRFTGRRGPLEGLVHRAASRVQ